MDSETSAIIPLRPCSPLCAQFHASEAPGPHSRRIIHVLPLRSSHLHHLSSFSVLAFSPFLPLFNLLLSLHKCAYRAAQRLQNIFFEAPLDIVPLPHLLDFSA